MSLKIFHIVFIVLSTALSLWFGVWCFRTGGSSYMIGGVLSFVVGGLLVYYGDRFFRKMKKLKYLWIGAALTPLSFASSTASACPICTRNISGPIAEAMNGGILMLLGLIVALLCGFGIFFLALRRRAKAHVKTS
jgi:hypothetical protein